MGSSKKQVTGYKYYTTLVSVLGNCIEGLLGINFDKKGWIQSKEVQDGLMRAGIHTIDAQNIYGENEGGVYGKVAIYDGLQVNADEHYQQHYALAPAYKGRSFVIFKDFYVGNSPFLKEMMLWPKRIHVKNDGSPQWYDEKAEIDTTKKYNFYDYHGRDVVIPEEYALTGTRFQLVDRKVGPVSEATFDTNGRITIGDEEVGPFSSGVVASGGAAAVPPETETGVNVKLESNFNGLIVVTIEYFSKGESHLFRPDPSMAIKKEWLSTQKSDDDSRGQTLLVYSYLVDATASEFIGGSVSTKGTVSSDLGVVENYSKINVYMTRAKEEIEAFGDALDINPIHKIRELLTDESAMNKAESDINEVNFKACADRIYDEQLGISWAITEKSCIDALNEICTHIEAGVRVNRQTGLYEVVLFRDDLNSTENALSFNESNIKSLQFDVQNSDEIINTLNVSYYDRENIKDSTFNVYENGLIRTVGHEQSENVDFPYFMNKRNAEIVANWKLKQFSTQAFKGSFTTGFYDARKINRFDIILLSWANRNIINLPCRVTGINLGDGVNNTVTIDFVEVVPYSSMMQSNINTDGSNNQILPPLENESIIFEMPYYEAVQNYGEVEVNAQLDNAPELGYAMVATKRPQNNSLNAQLQTSVEGGEWERTGVVHYAPSCDIVADIDYLTSSFIINNTNAFSDLKSETVGQINDELISFISFDTYTNTLTVKRGILDTIPAKHKSGDSIYFWDESSGIDNTAYLMGENVYAKALTTTPSGILDFDKAPLLTLNMNARAIRPYPPANIQINDEYYPPEIDSDLKITWADRNRKQQTGGVLVKWTDSSVTLEESVNYQLILTELDEDNAELRTQSINVGTLNEYTMSAGTMQANTQKIEIQLKSIRDGFDNYQTFNHEVELSTFFSAPYNLKVEFKND